jgi:hypothetical protein
MQKERIQLIDAAKRLCQQSEEMRARADRVMQHSMSVYKSHETRRRLRQDRKARTAAR